MAVSDWSTTAASNTTVGPVNIAEGCPAGNMNNMGREMMAQIAAWRDSLGGDYQAKDATLTALAALAIGADTLAYANGPDSFTGTPLTAFARTLLAATDQATAANLLGAVRVSAFSLANPGYIRFAFGSSSTFQVAWGNQLVNGEGYTNLNYAAPFPNGSWPVMSGNAQISTSAQDNNPAVTNATASGFTVWNANAACTAWYIAVGY